MQATLRKHFASLVDSGARLFQNARSEILARAAYTSGQRYHFEVREHHTITHLPHGFLDANIIGVLIGIVNFINIIDRGAANA
jgi:hypothetical protein